jgi:amino-acid N-acetyltransferase
VKRTRADVERQIHDFSVFELDRNPVACVAIHPYPEQGKAELACLFVDERYANRGIGAKLISYAEAKAKERGVSKLLCLTTQAVNYFQTKAGFQLGTPDDLPSVRREVYEKNGRRSQVLVKPLG